MNEERFDVAVVGARCAGAATARLLAQAGLRVVAIDRAAFPSDTVSTHAVAAHGVVLLEQWGLLDAVLATGVPNPRTIGFTVGAIDFPVVPVPDHSRGTVAPRRTILDHLLVDAARSEGAEVWEHTSVRDLLRDGDRVTGLRCRRADGTDVTVRASVVVGADGVRSHVARAVGAAQYGVTASRLGGVYAYYASTGQEQNELGLAPGALTVAFPTNDGLTVIAAGVDDSRFGEIVAGGDSAVAAVAEASSPRIAAALARGQRATRFFAYRPTPNRFVVPAGPGWALVGDAGLYLDPITGQGIANAFLSAALMADALVDGLGGACTMDDAMDRYRSERDALLAEAHATTSAASSLDWSSEEIVGILLRFRAAVDATADAVRARSPLTTASAPPA